MSFFDAKELYFICLCVFEPALFASGDETTLYLLLKNIYPVFRFFSKSSLLMVCSVYHGSCSLKVVIEVKNCSCSLVAILVTDFVSLACGRRKATELLEMHTKLASGSQRFRHKGRPLYALLFLFILLVSTIASLNGKLFFQLWVRFEVEVLSYCIFTEKFAIGIQN